MLPKHGIDVAWKNSSVLLNVRKSSRTSSKNTLVEVPITISSYVIYLPGQNRSCDLLTYFASVMFRYTLSVAHLLAMDKALHLTLVIDSSVMVNVGISVLQILVLLRLSKKSALTLTRVDHTTSHLNDLTRATRNVKYSTSVGLEFLRLGDARLAPLFT